MDRNNQVVNNISKSLCILELNYPLVALLNQSRSFKECSDHVVKVREMVKERRRDLAKKYHPDICGDGGEKMKLINAAYDFLMKLKVNYVQPRPVQPAFYFHFSTSSCGNTTTGTSFYSW